MGYTTEEIYTCDVCGICEGHGQLQKERLPKDWVFVEIIGSSGWKERFHLCPNCGEKLEFLTIVKEDEDEQEGN